MSHESIVYGFIHGAEYKHPYYRKLQKSNFAVLSRLPNDDSFPFLSRRMFCAPPLMPSRGTTRAQVIHFGASMNGLNGTYVIDWISKFEQLLRQLYWFEATAHIWTDFIDGTYQYWWGIDRAILETYYEEDPQPTSIWQRQIVRLTRELNGPPTMPWGSE